jgi:hypothetical protein
MLVALLVDRNPLSAFELLRRAGRTADGVLAQIMTSIAGLDQSGDDLPRWRAILDELRDDIMAGYDNDEALGEDRLDISRDVRALAAVLASNHAVPPLSVGLFGDWGSGKSFFMAKLRERIARLAEAAKDHPERESWEALFEAILAKQVTAAGDLPAWRDEIASEARYKGEREVTLLDRLAHRDGDFADWDAVYDAVCQVARFSFQTGRVLQYVAAASMPTSSESH